MNGDDELLPEGIPPFDDPAYDALRADLAGARVDTPIPAEVAARLDDVLAGLATEARAPETAVVPIRPYSRPHSRPRSRLGPRLLGAAAAVVLVVGGGIGIATMNGGLSGGNDDRSSASTLDSAADSGSVAENAPILPPGDTDRDRTLAKLGVERLSTATFSTQAARLITMNRTTYSLGQLQYDATKVWGNTQDFESQAPAPVTTPDALGSTASPEDSVPDADAPAAGAGSELRLEELFSACQPTLPATRVIPVLLDDRPAALVIYPVVDGKRRVEARDCSGESILASAVLDH